MTVNGEVHPAMTPDKASEVIREIREGLSKEESA